MRCIIIDLYLSHTYKNTETQITVSAPYMNVILIPMPVYMSVVNVNVILYAISYMYKSTWTIHTITNTKTKTKKNILTTNRKSRLSTGIRENMYRRKKKYWVWFQSNIKKSYKVYTSNTFSTVRMSMYCIYKYNVETKQLNENVLASYISAYRRNTSYNITVIETLK